MQHAFSSRTQGYFCCVKICFDLSLDDHVSTNSNVVFVIVFSVHNTHSGNCQKHSAKEISFGLYTSPPTMMLGFLHRQPGYCSVFRLTHVMSGPFGCRAG
jgi:spore coat protein U-like protein